jgi:hypothetical protein
MTDSLDTHSDRARNILIGVLDRVVAAGWATGYLLGDDLRPEIEWTRDGLSLISANKRLLEKLDITTDTDAQIAFNLLCQCYGTTIAKDGDALGGLGE